MGFTSYQYLEVITVNLKPENALYVTNFSKDYYWLTCVPVKKLNLDVSPQECSDSLLL